MNISKEDHVQVTLELGEVEFRIRYIINQLYDCCFVGPIVVIPLTPCGYQIKIGIPSIERPFSLAAELPDNLFFEHIAKELRFASLHTVRHFTLELKYMTLFPWGNKPNHFKIQIPKMDSGVNVKSIVQNIPPYINNHQDNSSTKPPIVIPSRPSTGTSESDWFGTEEEYAKLTNINPNINYYIYEEVGSGD